MTRPLREPALSAAAPDWSVLNQAWLMRAVAGLAHRLGDYLGEPTSDWPVADVAWPDDPAFAPPALETVCASFRLSVFEREVLLACAGSELDARFAALCTAAQGNGAPEGAARGCPTFGLALAALAEPHWSALGPDAPLRRWRLVEPGAGALLTTAPLRIDEHVLHVLAGVPHADERLAGLLMPVELPKSLPPSQDALAGRVAAIWEGWGSGAAPPLVQLIGPDPADRAAVAAVACRRLGLGLCEIAADTVPIAPAEIDLLARLCERESALAGTALLISCDALEGGDAAHARAALRLAERIDAPVFLGDRDPRPLPRRTFLTIEVPFLPEAEQSQSWRAALAGTAAAGDDIPNRLVWTFGLGAAAIRACAVEISARTGAETDPERLAALAWSVCRVRARARMEGLAVRVEPAARWEDLVLPAPQIAMLRQVAVHVRQRPTVYGAWGFAARFASGLGITALFHGASGTGKTLAAEVLAAELGLDLYRIDLSQVISKYIGETEKNLRRVFEAAEAGGAALAFEEADALFGRRSEVKDSHDRYANIEVSYLLQRMEAYRGLAVLTTNLKSALDTAFFRRIRFAVQFPFPDAAARAEIWRRAFPPGTPTEQVDFARLAQLELAGGNIRTIALGAAFLAAEAKRSVRMADLAAATRAEYAKLERPLNEADVSGWE